MHLTSILRGSALAAFVITAPVLGFAQDIDGASDHPLLSRFDGAVIRAYQQLDFDQVVLPAAPIDDEASPEAVVRLEGRVTRIGYHLPAEKTAIEIIRNYEQSLAGSGFDVDFSCGGRECGRRFANYVVQGGVFPRGFDRSAFNDRSRGLLASRQTQDATIHIFLFAMEDRANNRALLRQLVLESEPMQTGQVTVRDAMALGSDLEEHGRTVVDGIFFELDSADIRDESVDALEQMAALLNDNGDLRVYIVGHTDNDGSLAYNLELSQRRAAAVVSALRERHGIDAERLDAQGVANLAPLANNLTESGRALNRRVELVLQ